MKVFVGSDYRGFETKKHLLDFLAGTDLEVVDLGAYEYSEGDDFNDPAIAVAMAVREEPDARGILVCDSAHGVTMQANRFKGIRAAHCENEESAQLARNMMMPTYYVYRRIFWMTKSYRASSKLFSVHNLRA